MENYWKKIFIHTLINPSFHYIKWISLSCPLHRHVNVIYALGNLSVTGACRCQQQGHTHTNTYDRIMNHFQGSCTYVLTDAFDGDCGMIVWGKFKKEPGHKQSTLRNVTIFMYYTGSVDAIQLHQDRKIKVSWFTKICRCNEQSGKTCCLVGILHINKCITAFTRRHQKLRQFSRRIFQCIYVGILWSFLWTCRNFQSWIGNKEPATCWSWI